MCAHTHRYTSHALHACHHHRTIYIVHRVEYSRRHKTKHISVLLYTALTMMTTAVAVKCQSKYHVCVFVCVCMCIKGRDKRMLYVQLFAKAPMPWQYGDIYIIESLWRCAYIWRLCDRSNCWAPPARLCLCVCRCCYYCYYLYLERESNNCSSFALANSVCTRLFFSLTTCSIQTLDCCYICLCLDIYTHIYATYMLQAHVR